MRAVHDSIRRDADLMPVFADKQASGLYEIPLSSTALRAHKAVGPAQLDEVFPARLVVIGKAPHEFLVGLWEVVSVSAHNATPISSPRIVPKLVSTTTLIRSIE